MESTDLRNILSGPETKIEEDKETPKIKNSDNYKFINSVCDSLIGTLPRFAL